jgi:hypothetical protein
MSRGTGRAVALGLLLVLAAAAAGCGGEATTTRNAEYVALGDSYTSGPGMAPVADNSCRRSEINYPSLLAKKLKISEFVDRSCGGARLENLTKTQAYPDPRTSLPVEINDPQLDAVGPKTKLVTMGMGLNDKAIATNLLLICITLKSTEPNPTCQQYLKQPQNAVEDEIRSVATDLAAALGTIRRKAPDATIVLVGYPRLVPDHGTCGSPGERDAPLPVPEAQVARMRETVKFVDQVWQETAKQAGAKYVDVYDESAGHDICSADPWISGYLGVPGKAAGLHPLPGYMTAVADKSASVVGSL